jgi:hypothetical protein
MTNPAQLRVPHICPVLADVGIAQSAIVSKIPGFST